VANLPEPLAHLTGFQWDAGNSEKNWHSHAVSCAEAEEAFLNLPVVVTPDLKHSRGEPRFALLGRSNADRPLFVAFTTRDTLARVISARPMNRIERRIYEQVRQGFEEDPSL
jgi:hypothetical protein